MRSVCWGITKPLFDDSPKPMAVSLREGKILGGGMVGEIALNSGKTIHPYPTLGESMAKAAEVAHGACTDVLPDRK